jgi:hypothetical protein
MSRLLFSVEESIALFQVQVDVYVCSVYMNYVCNI